MGELSRGDFICLVSPKKRAREVLQEAQIPSGDAEGPTSQEHQGPTDLDRDLSQSPWPLCALTWNWGIASYASWGHGE